MNNIQNKDKIDNQSTEKLFFSNSDLNDSKIDKIVSDSLSKADPELHLALTTELKRQQQHIELIAS